MKAGSNIFAENIIIVYVIFSLLSRHEKRRKHTPNALPSYKMGLFKYPFHFVFCTRSLAYLTDIVVYKLLGTVLSAVHKIAVVFKF